MAKTWYPVVDYMTCTECGTCVSKCPHSVYDIEKAPSPIVKNPEACIDHCHGCGCCSEISGTNVDCRVFEYNGETYEVPPKEMLAEAILQTVFGLHEDSCSCNNYKLPENLRTFFEGKKSTKCSCGGNCC